MAQKKLLAISSVTRRRNSRVEIQLDEEDEGVFKWIYSEISFAVAATPLI